MPIRQIQTYAAREPGAALRPLALDPAPLGVHDVEIAVSHCGICHSDVHLVDDDWKMSVYPLVPGHEVVGRVTECGSEVRLFSERDGLAFNDSMAARKPQGGRPRMDRGPKRASA